MLGGTPDLHDLSGTAFPQAVFGQGPAPFLQWQQLCMTAFAVHYCKGPPLHPKHIVVVLFFMAIIRALCLLNGLHLTTRQDCAKTTIVKETTMMTLEAYL